MRGRVVGRLQHQEARDVEAAAARPEAAVSTEEEQELGEGHVEAQVRIEENGLNVDEQFFECKGDHHEPGSFNEAAAKGINLFLPVIPSRPLQLLLVRRDYPAGGSRRLVGATLLRAAGQGKAGSLGRGDWRDQSRVSCQPGQQAAAHGRC